MEELFRRHWPHTHRAAYLIVRDAAAAEDIAQEAFLSALSALDRFDRRRPFAPGCTGSPSTGRSTGAAPAPCATRWRRATRWLDAAGAAPAAAEELERGGEIEAALGRLSAEHRAVVILRYLLDYTPGEIGRMLDLPRGTVNSRLRRALDRLSGLIGGGAMREARLREALLDAPVPNAAGAEERGLAARAGCVRGRAAGAQAAAPRRRPPRPAGGGRGRPARRPDQPRRRRGPPLGPRRGRARARAGAAGAHLAAGARQPARRLGKGALDRPRGRLEAAARRLSRIVLVPRGLYVAATNRHEIAAVDPLGEVRWALARGGPVHSPAWSPDGYRVAYLNGGELRVVAGDGTGDRRSRGAAADVAPAWESGGAPTCCSYRRTRGGRVRTVQADSGRVSLRGRGAAGPIRSSIAWSADGQAAPGR